ncbi:hypothetical protein AWU65_01970 [Paenibacillus glucanolyticus]|jgi:hypothetical protein|uniref:Uncharacterized protein n=1 Tax=Paenibacillus glucanolyticus TaxID=59843 RepID=A0A163G7Y9_9BACL|nr:hypothetical protein [Paenibacillus glucanolyticus]KZS44782.1 hypothetical protein AWU65_01970 [Paenibacillus glucanolyticus]MDH6675693.1 hypothetical protein [Paenibacillus sp. LBL]OMF64447.1 hypothetical protein BK142_31860 [Paenibacillus glucanolyticus]
MKNPNDITYHATYEPDMKKMVKALQIIFEARVDDTNQDNAKDTNTSCIENESSIIIRNSENSRV